jgi:hypothetical protein
MGEKSKDIWVLPVCSSHHRDAHDLGDEAMFWTWHKIDPVFVCMALWINSGNTEAAIMIIDNAKWSQRSSIY